MGIVDTLTAGFTTVTRNPWLLIIPLLLDLLLWVGPKLSAAQLYLQLEAPVEDMVAEAVTQGVMDPSTAAAYNEQLALLASAAEGFNLLSLVALSRFIMPSTAAMRSINPEKDRVIQIAGPGSIIVIVAAVIVLGLLLASLYLSLLAHQVRGEGGGLALLVRKVPTFWLRMLAVMGMIFLLILGILVVYTILSLIAQVFAALAPMLGQLLQIVFLLGIWFVLLWVFFYLFFVPQAITLSNARPLEAMRQSFFVVRAHLWPALRLFVLATVISAGLGYLWSSIMTTAVGTIVAIVGNAFVGTGIISAIFIFFRDHLAGILSPQEPAVMSK